MTGTEATIALASWAREGCPKRDSYYARGCKREDKNGDKAKVCKSHQGNREGEGTY